MFKQLGPTELIIILAIVLLLFGGRKLPDAARGLGRSLRIFKAETRGLVDDANAAPAADAAPAPAPAPAAEPRKDDQGA